MENLSTHNNVTDRYRTENLISEVCKLRNPKNNFFKREIASRAALMFLGIGYSAYDSGHEFLSAGSMLLSAGKQKILGPKSSALRMDNTNVSVKEFNTKTMTAMAFLANVIATFVLGFIDPELEIRFLESRQLIKKETNSSNQNFLQAHRLQIGVIVVGIVLAGIAAAYFYNRENALNELPLDSKADVPTAIDSGVNFTPVTQIFTPDTESATEHVDTQQVSTPLIDNIVTITLENQISNSSPSSEVNAETIASKQIDEEYLLDPKSEVGALNLAWHYMKQNESILKAFAEIGSLAAEYTKSVKAASAKFMQQSY